MYVCFTRSMRVSWTVPQGCRINASHLEPHPSTIDLKPIPVVFIGHQAKGVAYIESRLLGHRTESGHVRI